MATEAKSTNTVIRLTPGAGSSRGILRQAYHDTLSSAGARIGLLWLGFLVFCAVFAPILANSHPLIIKQDGHWSLPFLAYLTPADIALVAVSLAVVVLSFLGGTKRLTTQRIVAALAIVAVVGLVDVILVKPPEIEHYQEYRNAMAEHRVQWIFYPPIHYSPNDRLRDQADARLLPPSTDHWLGTDSYGSDLASSLLHASRIALSIGFLSTSIAVGIGILIGGLMGYYVGKVDLIGMRLVEIVESIPTLFLLISITAFFRHRDIYLMMAVIGATSWTNYARFLRAEFLTIRKLDYVQAAIAAGLPKSTILFRHMLSNALTPILVNTTFGVAGAIQTESVLTFLGLGLTEETSWGGLLQQARAGGSGFHWWMAIFPGLAIFLTVFAYNLVGEAVRDALDPKLLKRD